MEQLTRLERRVKSRRTVEKERLLPHSHRLGLAERRDGDDVDLFLGSEYLAGCADRRVAVAEIGTEADVGARHGLATVAATVPSSPAGRTAGFRTRTRTRSGANRLSSSSATADASASSRLNCFASETCCTTRATST